MFQQQIFVKRLFLFLTFIGVALCAYSQTQNGFVKTKGRIGQNGQIIPGKRIAGVTIQIKGRSAVISNANGSFSFPIPAQKFYLESVKKKGYILNDPETITKQYAYSTNPLILVLDSPDHHAEDKLANERKIRRTLQRQLETKEEEIEALKSENKITKEEYQTALEQLYAYQESNERLISGMAERYAQIDFDQLDEFNLRISQCILDGRLTEADSLLRTKGDIHTRAAQLTRHHEANEQARETLNKSEALEQKTREEIAQDCYHLFEICKMKQEYDSAFHYISFRADLDTTNVQWQLDALAYFHDFHIDGYNIDSIGAFYSRALNAAIQNDSTSLETACCYINMASFYNNWYRVFPDDVQEWLENANIIVTEYHSDNRHKQAYYFKEIGKVYCDWLYGRKCMTDEELYKVDSLANHYLSKAMALYEDLEDRNAAELAEVYLFFGDYTGERDMYDQALLILESDSEEITVDLADCYYHIANSLYSPIYIITPTYSGYGPVCDNISELDDLTACQQQLENYEASISYYKKARELYAELFGESYPRVAEIDFIIEQVEFEVSTFKIAILVTDPLRYIKMIYLDYSFDYIKEKDDI